MFATCTQTALPVRPHQVGHPLVSLTTPEANMRRNRSQRANHIMMPSWGLPRDFFFPSIMLASCILNGEMRMVKKPASNRRISLEKRMTLDYYNMSNLHNYIVGFNTHMAMIDIRNHQTFKYTAQKNYS